MFLLNFCVTSIRASKKKSKVTAHPKRSSSIFLPLKCKKKELLKGNPFKSFISLPQSIRFFFIRPKKIWQMPLNQKLISAFFCWPFILPCAKKLISFFVCVTSFSLFIEMTFAHSKCWAHVIHFSFLFSSLHSELNETERVGIDILWNIKNHSGVVSIVYSHDGTTKQPVVTI